MGVWADSNIADALSRGGIPVFSWWALFWKLDASADAVVEDFSSSAFIASATFEALTSALFSIKIIII